VKILSNRLTTCGITADYETVELEFVDHAGSPVTMQLPLDQAEAVVMTLPHVLAYALKRRTGKPEARYVFGLGEWCIEDTRGEDSLIVTLKTTDGFEVSFGIPFQTCRALGFSLQHEANEAIAAGERDEGTIAPGRMGLN
jgi:hypothetical protein